MLKDHTRVKKAFCQGFSLEKAFSAFAENCHSNETGQVGLFDQQMRYREAH
jgi:hypothetical protein